MKLLRRLKKKDKKAVIKIYDQVYPRLEKGTKLAFQEALVVLFRQLKDPTFKLPCDLMDYVYSIAVHILKDKKCYKLDDETIELIRKNERRRIIQEKLK
jgi:hypothetical protein